jgi:hypothetical protein
MTLRLPVLVGNELAKPFKIDIGLQGCQLEISRRGGEITKEGVGVCRAGFTENVGRQIAEVHIPVNI